jgi:hypothetical protein
MLTSGQAEEEKSQRGGGKKKYIYIYIYIYILFEMDLFMQLGTTRACIDCNRTTNLLGTTMNEARAPPPRHGTTKWPVSGRSEWQQFLALPREVQEPYLRPHIELIKHVLDENFADYERSLASLSPVCSECGSILYCTCAAAVTEDLKQDHTKGYYDAGKFWHPFNPWTTHHKRKSPPPPPPCMAEIQQQKIQQRCPVSSQYKDAPLEPVAKRARMERPVASMDPAV